MRKSSQVVMGAITLATVITGWEIGATAKSNDFVAEPFPTETTTPTQTPTKSNKPGVTTKPTSTPTAKPTPTKPAVSTVTQMSSPVSYRYGTVQVSVTKTGSEITDISMIQAGATDGRGAAFPYLIQLALSAQNATFDCSMMSGATFTSQAFQQALDNALNKF